MSRLLLFVILAWTGFWLGHVAGDMLGWRFLVIGPLNVGLGTLGSAAFLLVGEWLSRVEVIHSK